MALVVKAQSNVYGVFGEQFDGAYFDTRKMIDSCNKIIAREEARTLSHTLKDSIEGTTDFSDSISAYLAAGRKVKHYEMMIVSPDSDEIIESL